MGSPVLILPEVSQQRQGTDRKSDFESNGMKSKYLYATRAGTEKPPPRAMNRGGSDFWEQRPETASLSASLISIEIVELHAACQMEIGSDGRKDAKRRILP
jgi:hypothetical protein